jgi:hypothetical protein
MAVEMKKGKLKPSVRHSRQIVEQGMPFNGRNVLKMNRVAFCRGLETLLKIGS